MQPMMNPSAHAPPVPSAVCFNTQSGRVCESWQGVEWRLPRCHDRVPYPRDDLRDGWLSGEFRRSRTSARGNAKIGQAGRRPAGKGNHGMPSQPLGVQVSSYMPEIISTTT